MPNTLCHIAIQAPLSRRLFRDADLLLIAAGCIIPDIPWVLQRVLLATGLFNPYDLRLYFLAQASLLFCLIAATAIALFSSRPLSVVVIVGGNCLLHLLLDASQIKWANGIHLLAPFSWQPLHYGMLWPEHPFWELLTVFGFFYLLLQWGQTVKAHRRRPIVTRKRLLAACCLFALYAAGPLPFLHRIEMANNYFIRVLRTPANRPGKYIELDRVAFQSNGATATTFAGEKIALAGEAPRTSGLVSVRGIFVNPHLLRVIQLERNIAFRNYASILGLFMACALLAHSVLLCRKKSPPASKDSKYDSIII